MSKAFTLIELLVVITIIVVLLALLTPALDRAMYEAQLVQCAGNLKVWGSIAVSFAQDHKRDLPMAFGPQGEWSQEFDSPRGARVLDRISDATADEASGRWKSYGTPWATWVRYGMADRAAVCPIWKGLGLLSSGYYSDNPAIPAPYHIGDTAGGPTGGAVNSDWGPQVWIGYEWIAGTDSTQPHVPTGSATPEAQPNEFAWNTRSPASNLRNASSGSVMASDLLYMNSGWASPPLNFRAVAYPTPENLAQPSSMGIAFGDTHVGIEREDAFERPIIFGTTGSPSRNEYSYWGGASYYWWGK